MNVRHVCMEYFVTFSVLLQCILDLVVCNVARHTTPIPQLPTEEEHSVFTDSVDLGITNILNIMESINSATNYQLVNRMMDDQQIFPINNSTEIYPLNDPEYQRFGCDIQCNVRPAHYTAELKRIQTLLPSFTNNQPMVIDCSRRTNPLADATNATSISVDCIAHYTGRLIHVIISYDRSARQNHSSFHAPVLLGDRFAETIQNAFEQHVSKDQKSTTSLYLTLELPIRTLDAADLLPIASHLKYLSVSSRFLQTIDSLLLQNLYLDYFLLHGCHRIQERVNRPQETKISPLPKNAHRWNCVVIWYFTCPTTGEFELLADAKTQERLCQRVQLPPSRQVTAPIPDNVPSRPVLRTRSRRSLPRRTTPGTTRSVIELGDPWPFFVEKLIHRFEDEIKNFGNDVRRDISWYQTMMNLFIGILALTLLILGATLVAFWIFLRQVLRGKIKPARATI